MEDFLTKSGIRRVFPGALGQLAPVPCRTAMGSSSSQADAAGPGTEGFRVRFVAWSPPFFIGFPCPLDVSCDVFSLKTVLKALKTLKDLRSLSLEQGSRLRLWHGWVRAPQVGQVRVDDAYSYDFRVEPPENTGAQGQVVRRTWEEVHQLAAAMAVRYRLVGPKKPFFDHGRLALAFRSKSILNQLSAWAKSRPKDAKSTSKALEDRVSRWLKGHA